MSNLKPTNPKDAIGSDKLPIHLWPETATALGCLGLLDGALKYGRSNWRESGVRVTIYVDALRRHVAAWMAGEEVDPDSGLPHLAHALACLAIIVDAQAYGKLTDDREYGPAAAYRAQVVELTPHVARLKAKHADKKPEHFTRLQNVTAPFPINPYPIDILRRAAAQTPSGLVTRREAVPLSRCCKAQKKPCGLATFDSNHCAGHCSKCGDWEDSMGPLF